MKSLTAAVWVWEIKYRNPNLHTNLTDVQTALLYTESDDIEDSVFKIGQKLGDVLVYSITLLGEAQ